MKRFLALVMIVMMVMTSLPLDGMTFAEDTYTELIISEYVEGSSYNKAIEIYNGTGATVDLANYALGIHASGGPDQTSNIQLNSGSLTELAAGATLVIAHSSAVDAVKQVSQIQTGSLNFNGNDLVVLKNGDTIIDSFGQSGNDADFAKDHTYRKLTTVVVGDVNLQDTVDYGVWEMLPKDAFDDLGKYGDTTTDPELPTDPETPSDPVVSDIKIYDIQGAAQVSPYDGQTVEGISGIVTATLHYKFDMYGSYIDGFYMQDPTGDANDQTSDAIFVRTSQTVSVGDSVVVSGTVKDYVKQMDFYAYDIDNQLSVTSLMASQVQVVSSGNPLPAPVILGQNGRVVPHDLIASENFATYDANTYAADFYESVEGMRVKIENPHVVSAYINRVVGVVPDGGATAKAENDLTTTGGVVLEKNDVNTEVLLVNGAIKPITSAKYILMGADFDADLVGIIDYEWTNYQLYITEDLPTFTQPTYERQSFKYETTDDELVIGSYNVYNHSATDEQRKTDGIAHQIVNDMKSPDILGLCEVQDNNGTATDGVTDASKTYEAFISAIQAAGGPTYEWIDIKPVYNAEGGEQSGNIRVGFLYNPMRVTLVDGIKGTSTQTVAVDESGHLTLNPGRIAATEPAFDGTRKSLAAEFEFNGENVIVIMDHLKSKGGDNGIYGNVQPPVLHSEDKRVQQAQLVNDFVDSIIAKNADAKIVVMGDMNDFQFSSPVQALQGDALVNMVDHLDKSEQFSYSFNGNAQVLDHILVSKNLVADTAVDIVNINSYFGKQDKINKHSDHDPIMVKIAGIQGEAPAVYPVIPSVYGEVAENTKVSLSSRTAEAKIYYAIDTALDLENLDNNTLYTEAITIDKAMTINAVAVSGDAISAVKHFEYRLQMPVSTVAEARAAEKGTEVALEVYLTSPLGVLGNKTFFFQDATGGGYVYNSNDFAGFEVGSHVRLEGTTDLYHGLFQMKLTRATLLDQPQVQAPVTITPADFGEAYEAQYIKLKNMIIDEISSDTYKNQKMILSKDGIKIYVKLDSRNESADFASTFTVGDEVTVQGMITEYDQKYTLILKTAGDVKKAGKTTVKEARELPPGSEVTLDVYLNGDLGVQGYKTFFFQDQTGGGYVYNKTDYPELTAGSHVLIEGKTSVYNGMFQINVTAITPQEDPQVQTPIVIAGSEFGEAYEAQLISLIGEIKAISSDKYNNQLLTVTVDGVDIQTKLDSRNEKADFTTLFAVGDEVTVTGCIYDTKGNYTLIHRSVSDVVKRGAITIAAARQMIDTPDVMVEGIVSCEPGTMGNKSFTFQDATSGAYIFAKSLETEVHLGDVIRLTGTPTEYKGLLQFKNFTIKVIGHDNLAPKVIDVKEIGESVENQLVTVRGLKLVSINNDKYNNAYATFENSKGSFSVKLDSRSGSDYDMLMNKMKDAYGFDVTGVVYQSNDRYSLTLRGLEDIKCLEDPAIVNLKMTDYTGNEVFEVKRNTFAFAACEIQADYDFEGVLLYKVTRNKKDFRIGILNNAETNQGVYQFGFDTFYAKKGKYEITVYYLEDLEGQKVLSEKTFYFRVR